MAPPESKVPLGRFPVTLFRPPLVVAVGGWRRKYEQDEEAENAEEGRDEEEEEGEKEEEEENRWNSRNIFEATAMLVMRTRNIKSLLLYEAS